MQLWEQGRARVLLNASVVRPAAAGIAAVTALGLESSDPAASAARAEALHAPVLPRDRGTAEADLSAVEAPDGTQVFFTRAGPGGWPTDFLPTDTADGGDAGLIGIDHVGLTQPFDAFDEAGLFYRAVLGLAPQAVTEFAAPFGLVRSRAVTGPDRAVRLALSVSALRRGGWSPAVPDPQYVAFATDDIVTTAGRLQAAGAPLLPVPANYVDDLDARLEPAPGLLAAVREHGLMYDEDERGGYLHLATLVFGDRVFFEVVQRLGGYDGYGSADAPVRMTAHLHARAVRADRPRRTARPTAPPPVREVLLMVDADRPRVLVLNGPNLNMLGTREPAIYGTHTLHDVEALVAAKGQELGFDVDCSQSNSEGELIDTLHAARTTHAGLVVNAGGLTHTSVVLRDAVVASELPFVEVHITNVHARESFRHTSLLSDVARAVIAGAGVQGYAFGLEVLHDLLGRRR